MNDEPIPHPFVKWAGGKRYLIEKIKDNMPKEYNNYYELFIGGGALFWSLADKMKKATIADKNLELMIAYKVIQKHPKELMELLKQHKANHSKDYYYKVRGESPETPVGAAARFI